MSDRDQMTASGVTAAQIRAARALLKMEQQDLCARSGVSIATMRRMEGAEGPVRGNYENVIAVVRQLESAGVEFIPENGGGAGVRLRKVSSANNVSVLYLTKAIHEAGHVIVTHHIFGTVAHSVTIGDVNESKLGLGVPKDAHEADRFATCLYAGRSAVQEAIRKSKLPKDVDASIGFVGPANSGSDQAEIERLRVHFRAIDDAGAISQANRIIAENWDRLVRIADLLANKRVIDRAELTQLLA